MAHDGNGGKDARGEAAEMVFEGLELATRDTGTAVVELSQAQKDTVVTTR